MSGIELFISDLKQQCKDHGIKLYLPKTKNVKLEIGYSKGYFDEETLACAIGGKGWLPILIHESCHLDQFIEKSPLWAKASDTLMDEWLSGKPIDNPDHHIDVMKWLELDCEKRAVRKFRKYKIKFNEREYIQKANSYVQFYNYMKYSRKWCNRKNTPYTNKNVWGNMPCKFVRKSWYNTIGADELKLFIRHKI